MPALATPKNKNLVLIAMIFAVAMMFIDQTIVALAVPSLQKDLHLSATGTQWIVNGYLLSLSALFALGGKLSDVLGHRSMLVVGVTGFAFASAMCGLTPTTGIGEAWMIFWRVSQGAFAALLFPAALAILVASFPLRERGKALAAFFGITGALTAVGPIAGGYLTEWTWRAIFWINIPVAIIALILIHRSQPENGKRDVPIDYRGAVLISAAMGLVVLGLQQASTWGWTDPKTIVSIIAGLILLGVFTLFELRQKNPLVEMRIFKGRAFSFDNMVLFLMSAVFVPIFFFASVYAQAALGYNAQKAGTFILVFFVGFALAAQLGGRILDNRGAKPAVTMGCIIAAVGFYLWGSKLDQLDFSTQWIYLSIAGAGLGLVLGPVSTDALNRAPDATYGEVTGLTQTVRNFGASLGLAIMGSIFASQNTSRVTDTLTKGGVPHHQASAIASSIGGGGSAPSGSASSAAQTALTHSVHLDIAHSTATVAYIMAGIMALSLIVARLGMESGRFEADAPVEADELAQADVPLSQTA